MYSITAVWALSLAYKKAADLDEDRAKVSPDHVSFSFFSLFLWQLRI